MKRIPPSDDPLIIRTDFSNPEAWKKFCEAVVAPLHGQEPLIQFVDDLAFEGLSVENLKSVMPEENDGFVIIADKTALEQHGYPTLIVELLEEPYETFRAEARHVFAIAANVAVGHATFFDFADLVDDDGVYRGMSDEELDAMEAIHPPEVPSPNLYIGNLPYNATDELLQSIFSAYGKVVSAKTARDPEGRFRGFGRVEMESTESAQKAKDQLDGQQVGGRGILIAFDGPQWPV